MNDTLSYAADYYRKRERAEREMAGQANSIGIRQIHLEMAERYRELAEQAEPSSFRRTHASAGA